MAAFYPRSMAPVIYLARHAETVFNAGGRMQGIKAHTPLTRAGVAQAEEMGAALARHFGERPDLDIWASPAGRTLQTAAIVAGLFSRKKLGAEATEIITNAAAGVVKNMQAEIDRQQETRKDEAEAHRAEREEWKAKMQELVDSHDAEMEDVRRVLQLHVAWDAIAIAKMNEIGVELPPAPPLLPPIKREHPEFE